MRNKVPGTSAHNFIVLGRRHPNFILVSQDNIHVRTFSLFWVTYCPGLHWNHGIFILISGSHLGIYEYTSLKWYVCNSGCSIYHCILVLYPKVVNVDAVLPPKSGMACLLFLMLAREMVYISHLLYDLEKSQVVVHGWLWKEVTVVMIISESLILVPAWILLLVNVLQDAAYYSWTCKSFKTCECNP